MCPDHECTQHTCDHQVGYLYFWEEKEGSIHKKYTFPKTACLVLILLLSLNRDQVPRAVCVQTCSQMHPYGAPSRVSAFDFLVLGP